MYSSALLFYLLLNTQAVAAALPQSRQASAINPSGRITTTLDNVKLETALREIERQSGKRFIFGADVVPIERLVSLRANGITVYEALEQVLRGTNITSRTAPTGEIALVRTPKKGAPVAQGTVVGKVTDKKSGKGVTGATVSSGTREVVTGEDGAYRLSGISAGAHTITVRLVGYARQTRSITVEDGAQAVVDFNLEPSASVLDQVVVTGTVVATELKAVPSAITVVTAKELQERGITRIDQLFRGDVPGLFSMNNGSWNTLDTVAMFSRGASTLQRGSGPIATNAIKTYVDGVELANPSYLSQIDPSSIERIEILTGPQASTIYGSNAINGVMQIFTKRGGMARPQLMLNLTSGVTQNNFTSHLAPQHLADAQLSGTEGRASYNVGGSYNYMGAWTPSKLTSRISGYGSGRIQFGPVTGDASFRKGLTRNVQRGNGDQAITAGQESGEFSVSSSSGRASPAVSKLNGHTFGVTGGYAPFAWWSHEIVVGNDESTRESWELAPKRINPSDSILSVLQFWYQRASQRYSTTAQLPLASMARATVTAGVDHWRTASTTFSATPITTTGLLAGSRLTRNKPEKNTGGFVQGQIGMWDALFLTYGLRAEWNPNYGENEIPNLAPRYGIAYTKDVASVTAKLRASYGRSTRPPTADQRLAVPIAGYDLDFGTTYVPLFGPYDNRLANPDLGPEFQQGGEGGIELYFGNRASLIVTRYNQTIDDLINFIGSIDSVRSILPNAVVSCVSYGNLSSDGYCYAPQEQNLNVGSVRNQGWELQGSMKLGPFATRGTYSWTKSRLIGITESFRSRFDASTYPTYQAGYSFTNFPEHTWATSVTYAKSATRLALNLNGTGFQFRLRDDLYYAVNNRRLPSTRPRTSIPSVFRPFGSGYTMADLNASHRLSSRMETVLQVHNLTDFYRSDRSSQYATMGRQTSVGVRIRW